jgi:hypothetical protein
MAVAAEAAPREATLRPSTRLARPPDAFRPQEVLQMSERPSIYADLSRSICPSVYGHDAIKQAILLMLFGGVYKRTIEVGRACVRCVAAS